MFKYIMTTQDDLQKLLKNFDIHDFMFHYVDYHTDILHVVDIVIKSKIPHNIIMLMSNKGRNHWVYIHFEKKRIYYFDSYGCIPNMYQLLDDFNNLSVHALLSKRKTILKELRDNLHKEYKFYFNDFIFQKNVFGIIQGDADIKETDTCGQFCVCCAHFMDLLKQKNIYVENPDLYILSSFNVIQASIGENYDDCVKKIMRV